MTNETNKAAASGYLSGAFGLAGRFAVVIGGNGARGRGGGEPA